MPKTKILNERIGEFIYLRREMKREIEIIVCFCLCLHPR